MCKLARDKCFGEVIWWEDHYLRQDFQGKVSKEVIFKPRQKIWGQIAPGIEFNNDKGLEVIINLSHSGSSKVIIRAIYFCFIDYAKAFDCVDHNKLENSERDGNTRPSDLPLRNLYAGYEAIVRTRCGTTEWFQIGKGVHQGCILSPCLFN